MLHIALRDVSYHHDDDTLLFSNVSLGLEPGRYGLVGPNGCGKTTLLRILVGELRATAGWITSAAGIGYLPQLDSLDNGSSITQTFAGFPAFEIERALERFGCPSGVLSRTLGTLSGGERIRLRIARVCIANPDWMLLDEPTNYLDEEGRALLHEIVREWRGGLIVASHDRELLELLDVTLELSNLGLRRYGGPYSLYRQQRLIEEDAVAAKVANQEATLEREQRKRHRELERIARRSATGRRHAFKENLPKSVRKAMQKKAKATAGERRAALIERLERAQHAYESARSLGRRSGDIHFSAPDMGVPRGKVVFDDPAILLHIVGPERIAVVGSNGSGKTTLLRKLGTAARVPHAYLDQRLEVLPRTGTIADAMREVAPLLTEHARRGQLARLGFEQERTLMDITQLSGGERMRAALALLFVTAQPPQLLLLDEPETHLDLVSLEQLESALADYPGALVVVSHDASFREAVGLTRTIVMKDGVAMLA